LPFAALQSLFNLSIPPNLESPAFESFTPDAISVGLKVQRFEHRATTINENVERTGEWVFLEYLAYYR
jgi:hypothetical protein